MSDQPRMTVAIPTCNGQRHLAAALRSILAQTGVAFELLIADDRSDDETLAVARAEAGDRARVVVNSARLGLAGNWNQCVALSRTPLVAIFHQDDVMYPGGLTGRMAALNDDRVGLACSAANVIDDEGRNVPASIVERGGLGPIDRTFGPGEALHEMAVANPLRCSAVTLRAAAHGAVGGFDPKYRYVVDWDCWLRIARDWSVAWLARPTVALRWHRASETHRFQTGTADLEETAQLVQRLLAAESAHWPDAARVRRLADRRLAGAYLNRSYETLRSGDARLGRSCASRAITLWPGIMGRIALDPRFTARLLAPDLARRWTAAARRS